MTRTMNLVRRSILMRLILSSEGRWPLRGNNPPPVDQILTAAAEAAEWRDTWQQQSQIEIIPAFVRQVRNLRLKDCLTDLTSILLNDRRLSGYFNVCRSGGK